MIIDNDYIMNETYSISSKSMNTTIYMDFSFDEINELKDIVPTFYS